jgi:hypothetical protein
MRALLPRAVADDLKGASLRQAGLGRDRRRATGGAKHAI